MRRLPKWQSRRQLRQLFLHPPGRGGVEMRSFQRLVQSQMLLNFEPATELSYNSFRVAPSATIAARRTET